MARNVFFQDPNEFFGFGSLDKPGEFRDCERRGRQRSCNRLETLEFSFDCLPEKRIWTLAKKDMLSIYQNVRNAFPRNEFQDFEVFQRIIGKVNAVVISRSKGGGSSYSQGAS